MREADWAVAWDEIGSSKIREEVEILNFEYLFNMDSFCRKDCSLKL